jgi:hypothetical protein
MLLVLPVKNSAVSIILIGGILLITIAVLVLAEDKFTRQ